MHSHAGDLRAELLQTEVAPEAAQELVEAVLDDWKGAGLGEADQALCTFAEKLTQDPGSMQESDLQVLRSKGFGDELIHDAVQVISYFNYINRVADAAHVDLDPGMPPYPVA